MLVQCKINSSVLPDFPGRLAGAHLYAGQRDYEEQRVILNDAIAEIKTLTFNALTRHQSNALTDISGTLNFSLRYLFSRFPFGSSQTVYQPVALTFLIKKLEAMSRVAAFTSFRCKAKVLSNNMEKFSNDC